MKSLEAKYTATEFFSEFSTTYIQHATWAKNKLLSNAVIEIVTSKHPASIVDLGTGNGQLLSLFPQVRNRIGIDMSHQMLAAIHDRSIDRILGDVHSVALQTSSVDFVVCRQVLHYCRANLVLQEANRILRNDGYALVVQMTDVDTVPTEWYAKWKAFKQIRERKHLTLSAIIHSAAEANFEVELQRYCPVNVELRWNDLYRKYAAFSSRQQNAISTFFRDTPDSISKPMRLNVDNQGISYQRGFVCLLLRKPDQCPKRV
jgi:ubiquinone/menaquinone biosynthesis C-methylase UbiE